MSMLDKAALLGGGVIGGGWAARLLFNGVDVALYDPDPEAERKVGEVLSNAEHAFAGLFPGHSASRGELRFVTSIAEAVDGASRSAHLLHLLVDVGGEALDVPGVFPAADGVVLPEDLHVDQAVLVGHGPGL